MKAELVRIFSKKHKKKSRFSWTLNENKYLTLQEVEKLRETCEKGKNHALRIGSFTAVRDWFVIELGLNAGLRVKEMAGLKHSDLLINGKQSSIVAVGKKGKKRSVWINKDFKERCLWFIGWKQNLGLSINPDSYLITSRTGSGLTTRTLQKAFKKCLEKAGLQKHYSIHCLRHTYGSHLYVSSGHNLRLVQEQLGHSSVRVTEVYANLMDKDAKIAVESLYK